ncbi:hypothetical protein [Luteitalea sp.]|uniref:hypothetical protein n=1 Tax=Luteitalea sp. TaxID=2004800 RepID=UPI0025BE9A2F|nr:hypothetical protein [Luteitalea sp.]
MTPLGANEARVRAIAARGFTVRQARFLTFVLRHSGVCVPRQYASFAGTVQGAKCNGFFARLVARGDALRIPCLHNRAQLYRLHARALYDAIGEERSRYRRVVSPSIALERLMRLDAVLAAPHLTWLDSAAEKAEALGLSPTAALPDACPIGLDEDGRIVVLYVAHDPWPDRFRTALRACVPALLTAPRWTLRIAVKRDWPDVYGTYLDAIHEELEQLFTGADATRLAGGWERGDMRVDSFVLSQAYGHLSPLVDRDRQGVRRPPEGVERGEARGEDSRRRPRPLAWAPWPSRDRRMVL